MFLPNYNLTPLFPSKPHEELRNNVRYNSHFLWHQNNAFPKLLVYLTQLDSHQSWWNRQSEYYFSHTSDKRIDSESEWLAQENLASICQTLTMTQLSYFWVNITFRYTSLKSKIEMIVINVILNWEMCELTSREFSADKLFV